MPRLEAMNPMIEDLYTIRVFFLAVVLLAALPVGATSPATASAGTPSAAARSATAVQTQTLPGAQAVTGIEPNKAAPKVSDGGERQLAGWRSENQSPNNPRRLPNEARVEAVESSSAESEVRSVTGSGNNVANPDWGAANTMLRRTATPAYADGKTQPRGEGSASAREISNLLLAQFAPRPNASRASDFVWQWGQFLDHDIDLTPIASPAEDFGVLVPIGDPWFDPEKTGQQVIPLERSSYNMVEGVRQQVNAITAFIDASNVYGSDPERARELRSLDGTGRLRVSAGELLPYNENGLPNAPSTDPSFFLAGDFRANEQVGLTVMHTLFVREHNYWAGQIATTTPGLGEDEIYEAARRIVGAEMQAITYREFLPILLGPNALRPYTGYDENLQPSISNEFATAAYRVGHTMLSGSILRFEEDGSPSADGPLDLAQMFFRPTLLEEHGIDSILRGLAMQRAEEVDLQIVDDVRNLLFGPPGEGGLDLASLNIQRGRDHGLTSYNQTRVAYGLAPAKTFGDIRRHLEIEQHLRQVYASVDDVDLWVGGLAEPHVPGALVGPTFFAILADQFRCLRDGDRFWYQHTMPPEIVELVEEQTLSKIIRRNTGIGSFLPDDVFRVDLRRSPLARPGQRRIAPP